jgi:hypothetical protein
MPFFYTKRLHITMTQTNNQTQGWPSSQQQTATYATYALENHGALQSQFRGHRRRQHTRATPAHSGNWGRIHR